ncbi:MAG TPA: IS91 family transposase [Terriglobales bacterium]|nr:IS91 family transposase [Terriglobales bacterium]
MYKPAFELAGILRRDGPAYRENHRLLREQERVIDAIVDCRTEALGGHVEECCQCAYTRIRYNSCRNRHCPKCQSLARAKWVEARKAELLPVEYFHVVFTVPKEIAEIAFYNRRAVYDILFRATAQTLTTIARDPRHLGAEIGFFAVLHTWGQNLLHHPHLHCVVPGGGLSPDGKRWISCPPGFFLHVKVLSRLFRRLFLEQLEDAFYRQELRFPGSIEPMQDAFAFADLLCSLEDREWVVYAKPPFGGPRQALDYLGRYTHRVALSNERLLDVKEGQVTFQWKDYRSKGREKSRVMTLESDEFIRRFLIHVLPRGFQRIRFFGLLANRNRKALLAECRRLLAPPMSDLLPNPDDYCTMRKPLTEESIRCCPNCGKGEMVRILTIAPAWPSPDSS